MYHCQMQLSASILFIMIITINIYKVLCNNYTKYILGNLLCHFGRSSWLFHFFPDNGLDEVIELSILFTV